MKNLFKIFSLFLLITVISGCKIDFEGDVYTSDLIGVLESQTSIDIPMHVSFQVSACDEDLDDLHMTLNNYFIDYQFMTCETGNDFMTYATSKVKVPVTSSGDHFDSTNSLVGYLVQEFDDGIYVFMTLNNAQFDSLNNYVENETFQSLSLEESKFHIKIYNDMDYASINIFPSFVDGIPIIYETNYEMSKRETLNVVSSQVGAAHLEYNGWSPIFKFVDAR